METVEHDGRATAYRSVEADGAGPTVLYVHGSGATHRLWAAQYAPRGPAHPAVALDLSGHGDSEDADGEAGSTLERYVADVVAVARETGATVLAGNSLGGAVVLQAVLDDRLTPAGLVLAGTGAKLTVAEELRELLATDFESAIETLHGSDMLFHDASARLRDRSVTAMRAVGQSVTRRDFAACHRFDVRDRLDEVGVPTLAVCGEYDRLTPPSYHEYLATELPDATVETVSDAAHLAMAERPVAFDAALARFFEERLDR